MVLLLWLGGNENKKASARGVSQSSVRPWKIKRVEQLAILTTCDVLLSSWCVRFAYNCDRQSLCEHGLKDQSVRDALLPFGW